MRTLAAAVLYLAACGGSAPPPQAPQPVADTAGPVTRPDPAPAGDPASTRDPAPAGDPAPPRASTMVTRTTAANQPTDDDPLYGSPNPGPRGSDEPLPAVTPQPPAKGCSPDKFIAEGKDKLAMGMNASALAAIEKALVCVHDPAIEKYAVLAACKGKLFSRARAHFIRLADADKPTLAQICAGPSF